MDPFSLLSEWISVVSHPCSSESRQLPDHQCTLLFEPGYTPFAAGEFGDDTGIDVAALVGTPANKAGTPFHTLRKSVPAPIGFTAHIADLGFRYFHDQL